MGVTVAVSTVFAPTATGFTEELNAVVLGIRFTVSLSADEVLVA